MKNYYVYILASDKNGTLYVGVTSDLITRVNQHRSSENKGFTAKYNVKKLVYYEIHEYVYNAIEREKQIKRWLRRWKIALIEKSNPEWNDLVGEFLY